MLQDKLKKNVARITGPLNSLLFCRGRQRNVPRIITHVHSHCFSFSDVLVAVAVVFFVRSLIIWNADANFLNLHIDKARKTHNDKQTWFNHTFYETNFKPKLLTVDVKCNGTVLILTPQNRKGHSFSKFSINGGDLVFWFAFNLAVHFRPKMALTLEILSD